MAMNEKIAKMTNILNDCLEDLDGLVPAAGIMNCGRVFVTAQNIRTVLRILKTISAEEEKKNDCNGDEVQSES